MRVLRALVGGALGLVLSVAALAQPIPLSGLSLVDARGLPLAAESMRGRIVLLHLIFTGCSTSCPTQVRELAALHDALPALVRERVQFVSVSLDPHDTPATLASFARRLDARRDGWHFASGRADQVDRLAERLQAFDLTKARPALADHRTSLWVFDGAGALVQRYAGVPVDRPRLQRELTQLASITPSSARRTVP